jgi:hypothetical protein
MPSSTSQATWRRPGRGPRPAARRRGARPSRARLRSLAPLLWAACSSGARSAAARSAQCCSCWVPRPTAGAASVIARAVWSASSQLEAAATGDQWSSRTCDGVSASPVGSNAHTSPRPARAPIVASRTSVLVDVETSAPGHARTEGMTTPLVFPERGAPSTSTACSRLANTPWPPARPRNAPPPRAAQRSRTAASMLALARSRSANESVSVAGTPAPWRTDRAEPWRAVVRVASDLNAFSSVVVERVLGLLVSYLVKLLGEPPARLVLALPSRSGRWSGPVGVASGAQALGEARLRGLGSWAARPGRG